MTDTPEHIKALQLKIWLSKTPGERLKQFMEDNEKLYLFWDNAQVDTVEKPMATSPPVDKRDL